MAGEQLEIVIDANGLARTEQVFKTLDKYMDRIHRRMDKLGRLKVNPMVRLIDRVTPQLNKINRALMNMNRIESIGVSPVFPKGVAQKPDAQPVTLKDRLRALLSGVFSWFSNKLFGKKGKNDKNDTSFIDRLRNAGQKVASLFSIVSKSGGYAGDGIEILERIRDFTNARNVSIMGRPAADIVNARNPLNNAGVKKAFEWIKKGKGFFTGIGVAGDAIDIVSTKSGTERGKKTVEAVGGLGGGLALGAAFEYLGGALGTLIPVPGLGTAIGIAVGGYLGDKYGKKLADYAFDNINAKKTFGKVKETYENAEADVKGFFNDLGKLTPKKITEYFMGSNLVSMQSADIPYEPKPPLDAGITPMTPVSWQQNSFSKNNGELSLYQTNQPRTSGPTNVNVNLPVGAIQLTFQGAEPNYEEISIHVGNKITNAIQQAMVNRTGYRI